MKPIFSFSGFFTEMLVPLEAFSCFSRAPTMSSSVYRVSTINKRYNHSGRGLRGALQSKHRTPAPLMLQWIHQTALCMTGGGPPWTTCPPNTACPTFFSRWIALIMLAADVCFTGHGGAPCNSIRRPTWRVWRTLNVAHKKNNWKKKGREDGGGSGFVAH